MKSATLILLLFIFTKNFGQSDSSIRRDPVLDLVEIKGRITDSKTGKGLRAFIIIFTERDTSEFSSNDSGYYNAVIRASDGYTFTIESTGYLFFSQKTASLKEQNDFELSRMQIVQCYRLPSVLFKPGTDRFLDSTQVYTLDKLIRILKANPELKICVIGHTDSEGSSRKKFQLSESRMKQVISYLFGEIDMKRISGEAMADTQPIVPNDSKENRQLNNRVDFRIEE